MGDLSSLAAICATALGGTLLLIGEPAPHSVDFSAMAASNASPSVQSVGILVPTKRKAGRIYLAAKIASAPTHFIVDTGASHTILSKRDAQRAGAERGRIVSVATAGGTVTMEAATISTLTIDEKTIFDVDVLVCENIADSLLGMDVLDRLGATHVSLSPR
jgi:aspartyl protease family protein